MSSFRITTNGLYRNYRTNLYKNNAQLSDAMTTVQTSRKFNTYAEDPAAASKAWRLRRAYWRTGDQIDNTNYVLSKYESAYTAMAAIVDGDSENRGLDGIISAVEGLSDAAGSARNALGKELTQTAENVVSMMNSKYGEDFVFAAADGANIPFTWSDSGQLLYRGIDVTTPKTVYTSEDFGVTKAMLNMEQPLTETEYNSAPAGSVPGTDYNDYKTKYLERNNEYTSFDDAMADRSKVEKYNNIKTSYENAHPGWSFENALKLSDMANEITYLDIGLGMQEDESGKIISGSAFNSSISGLKFLGYGEDSNLVVIMKELGEIFSRADPETGAYQYAEDEARASELLDKLHDAVRYSQGQHVQLSADAKYLKTNLSQLETNKAELNTQIVETEDKEMADAITEMTWAQYCYNAALRIGTQILSQSLLDYMG